MRQLAGVLLPPLPGRGGDVVPEDRRVGRLVEGTAVQVPRSRRRNGWVAIDSSQPFGCLLSRLGCRGVERHFVSLAIIPWMGRQVSEWMPHQGRGVCESVVRR